MALKVGELYGVLKLDRSQFDKGMRGSGQNFQKFKKAILIGGVIIAAALLKIGKSALTASMDFQKGMANVNTLIGDSAEASKRTAELGENVKDLARETGKSVADLTDGLYQVISAFGDTEGSMKKLDIAARASTAGLSTTKDAVNLLSAVTKGYDRTSVKATQKASDLAFMTVVLGQTSFPELAASMGQVVPVAAALGVKQTELFAGFAALTGVTGNTAAVATQLKGAFIVLSKPTSDLKKAYKELNVETGKQLIKKYGLIKALDKLNGTRVVQKKGLAQVLGSTEALQAVQSLVGAQADDYREKLKKLNKAQGSTDEAYKIQSETVAHSLARVKASWDVLLINLGDKFLPKLEELLDFILENMPAIEAAFESAFEAIGNVFTWLIENVLPPARKGLEVIIGVIDAVVSAIAGFAGVDKGLIIGVGLAIAGVLLLFMMHPVIAIIAGIVLGLGLLATAWEEDWGGMRTTILEIWGKIEPIIDGIKEWFTNFLEDENVKKFASFFMTPFENIALIIGGIIDTIVLILDGDLAGALDKIVEVATNLKDNVVEGIRDLIGGLSGIAPEVLKAAGKIGGAIFNGIISFVKALPEAIGSIIASAVNFIVDAWNSLDLEIPEFHFTLAEAFQAEILGRKVGWDKISIDFGGSGDLIPDIARYASAMSGSRGLSGRAKGDWNVGSPMPALLHAGEMVIPAAIARQMREGSSAFGDLLSNTTTGQGPIIGTQNINGIQPNEVERQTRRAIRRQQREWRASGQ